MLKNTISQACAIAQEAVKKTKVEMKILTEGSDNIKAGVEDISDIDNILKSETIDFTKFFEGNFNQLHSRNKDDKVTKDNFVQIQAEATLLRKLQIELIQHIAANNGKNGGNLTLDGNNIMKVFQESDVYQKYFGEDGLGNKIAKFQNTLGDNIPAFNTVINHSIGQEENQFKLPKLEIREGKDFASISEELKSALEKLDEMSKENLSFNSLEPNKQNLDKMKLIALKSDPMLLGMMCKTKQGVELEEKSRGAKLGRFAATALLLFATAALTAVITGIAAPALITALGGSVKVKIFVGVGASLTEGAIAIASAAIGKKIDNIGKKDEIDSAMTERANKIAGMKIDKFSKELVKNFDKAVSLSVGIKVEKQNSIAI